MEILEAIVRKPGFGGGKGEDISDNLDDMSPVEKFVMDVEHLKIFATLDIPEVVKDGTETVSKGKTLIVKPGEDVEYDGETVGGLCHAFNKEFVAGRLPFYARPHQIEGKTHTTKAGKLKRVAEAVKIQRVSEDYDESLYATEASGRIGKAGRLIDHEEPTEGMRLRASKWMKLHETELKELYE